MSGWQPIATCPEGVDVLLYYPEENGRNHRYRWVTIGRPGRTPRQPTMWAAIPPVTLEMTEQGASMEICEQGGKRCMSRDEAQRTVKQLKKDWGTQGETDTLRAYRCGGCGRWHVGHQFNAVRRQQ